MRRSGVCASPPSPSSLAAPATPAWDERKRERAPSTLAESGAPIRISWLEGIHDLPIQHPDALARRIQRFSDGLVR